LYRLKQYQI